MRRVGLALALVVTFSAVPGVQGTSPAATQRASRAALSPQRFAEVASGITLIRTRACSGRLTGSASGFLIGDRIVMTARHVVDPKGGPRVCRTDVRVKGRWIEVEAWSWWFSSRPSDGRVVDLAVLKLAERVDAHLFQIRSQPVPLGTNVATIGHPLGNQLSVTQGRLILRKRIGGVPIIAVRLLGAEGGSGSPFVDNDGKVVGILQSGLGSEDVLGQRTSGVIVGLDLNSWWGSGKRALCRSYPDGGIPMCGASSKPRPSPPPPPPACLDKALLRDAGPDWKAGTDAWSAFDAILNGRAAGDFVAAVQQAFDALELAASSASAYVPDDVCSTGLQRALSLIAGVPTLVETARTAFQTYLETPARTPEGDAALRAAAAALSALSARVKAIDAAFAAR